MSQNGGELMSLSSSVSAVLESSDRPMSDLWLKGGYFCKGGKKGFILIYL